MPPVRGRELKQNRRQGYTRGKQDAPCAGARIETSKSTKNLTGANKMPPVWSLVEDFW